MAWVVVGILPTAAGQVGGGPIDTSDLVDRTDDVLVEAERPRFDFSDGTLTTEVRLTNGSPANLSSELLLVLEGLPAGVSVEPMLGVTTAGGDPVIAVTPSSEQSASGIIEPLESLPKIGLRFGNPGGQPLDFTVRVLELPSAAPVIQVATWPPDGPVGGSFTFSVGPGAPSDATYTWDINGLESTGREAIMVADTAGLLIASVTATDANGRIVGRGSGLASVLDDRGQDLAGEPLPQVAGDFDGNGALELADQLAVRQVLADLLEIDDEQTLRRVDFDFDGNLTVEDADLATARIFAGSRGGLLLPDAAAPGGTIEIYSPALDNPANTVEVLIGGRSLSPAPTRLVPGRLALQVPLDVLTPGELTMAGGMTDVTLLVDGAPAEVLAFEVLEPAPINTGDPLSDLRQAFTDARIIREEIIGTLATPELSALFAELGYEPGTAQAFGEIVRSLGDELDQQEQLMLATLEGLSPANQLAIAMVLNAQGLQDALVQSAPFVEQLLSAPMSSRLPAAGSAQTLNASELQALCRLTQALELVSTLGNAGTYGCTGLTVICGIAIVSPIDGGVVGDVVACGSAISYCATFYSVNTAISLVGDLMPRLGQNTFRVTRRELADTSPPQYAFTAEVTIESQLCRRFGGRFTDWLVQAVYQRVLKKGAIGVLRDLAGRLNAGILKWIDDEVNKAVRRSIGIPLDDLIGPAVDRGCDIFRSRNPYNVVEPSLVGTAGEGSFVMNGTEILYTCNSNSSGTSELTFTLATCLGTQSTRERVDCGDEVDVLVRIGDNGSANDDIFEAAIDGRTVLTMNAPSRGVSATVPLSTGPHTLTMRGLAAPDGIGTYFVTLSANGQTIFSRSGRNLTAGTVFTFSFNVPEITR